MKNQSVLNILFAVLATAVVLTVLIMDEEVLVLYVFVTFCGLSYHFVSGSVDEQLRSDASKMGVEFDKYFEVQKKVLKTLIQYHVTQILVISQLKNLLDFSKSEITKVIEAKKKSFDAQLATQIEQKLAYIAAKELSISAKVQSESSDIITKKIRTIFETDNKQKGALKEKILTENLAKLESLKA